MVESYRQRAERVKGMPNHEVYQQASTNGTEPGAAAPWPEPDLIDAELPAPPLDLTLFPEEIAALADDVAERQQTVADFVAWPTLCATAGLIGRSVAIRPRAFDDWAERPSLWIALIGKPSTLKTPAQDEGTRSLRRQQERDHLAHEFAMTQWEADCRAARAAEPKHPEVPPAPSERRWWTADVTMEKVPLLLQPEVSRHLTIVRDELSGFILGMDRYKQQAGDRQFWLQAYSGGPYTVDRVTRPSVFVPDLLVNIVGGIQPEMARPIFGDGPDDGFAARFLSVWPEPLATWERVDRWPNHAARNALDVVHDALASADWPGLLEIDHYRPTPFCRLDADAQRVFDAWHARTMLALRSGAYEGLLESRVGKYPGLIARLILTFHLFDCAAGRAAQVKRVSAETATRVITLADHYILPMEQRVYSAYARTEAAESGSRIARWIIDTRQSRFTTRDVYRHQWTNLKNADQTTAALDWLASKRWLREVEPDRRPGRPTSSWEVNPGVHHEAYA